MRSRQRLQAPARPGAGLHGRQQAAVHELAHRLQVVHALLAQFVDAPLHEFEVGSAGREARMRARVQALDLAASCVSWRSSSGSSSGLAVRMRSATSARSRSAPTSAPPTSRATGRPSKAIMR